MSKQYAHLHAMAKTSVKFQNDWPKIVGGVALTSQLLPNGQMDERTGHGTPIRLYRTCMLMQVRQNPSQYTHTSENTALRSLKPNQYTYTTQNKTTIY